MRIDAFDFDLPADRIAQRPVEPRDASKLLVVDPAAERLVDATVRDLPSHIPAEALLVVNDTRVIRARLLGRKADTGGKVELLLVRKVGEGSLPVGGREHAGERWLAMGKASKGFRFPTRIVFGDDTELFAILESRSDDGLLQVVLVKPGGGSIRESIARLGHVPLPPYIRREDDASDTERYQTVYARQEGAIAAPTAGLHLTHSLLGALGAKGVQLVTVTLHVGPGTFQPVTVDDLDQHAMHEEWYEIPRFTARVIQEAKAKGRPVIAVGTTTVRALESAADGDGGVQVGPATTRLLIQPGYQFRVVDALLTNFHLPKSTLLALVSAMAGRERLLRAYRHAIESGYRFFSYGDAMLIKARVSPGEAA